MKAIWLISKSVLIEAVRRREIYVIVAVSSLFIGAVMTVNFFEIEGLTKFYREIALKIMSIATAITVVVLSSRQLPREFERRTIYPLLARPINRTVFLSGKLMGVMLSAAFCFILFMLIYIIGTIYLGGKIPWVLFLQYIYLQLFMMLILATLCFWLSMMLNLDAAITIGILLYTLAATFMSVSSFIYDYTKAFGRIVLIVLTWIIPQLSLFDLSGKAVHAEVWEPVSLKTMAILSIYGLTFTLVYFSLALLWFRRRPL